ncbi:unnamed protein product, partial [Ixodes hexagonus]
CETQDCYKVAWLFRQAVDLEKNPCDNFYQYVCGKVIQQYGPRKYSTVSQMGDNLTSTFHASLSNAKPARRNQTAFDKAASFYQSCLKRFEERKNHRVVLINFLESNNLGFRKGRPFDTIQATVQLLFVHNINFLFRVQVDRTLSKDKYRLTITSSPEFIQWIKIRKILIATGREYEEYVTEVLNTIGLAEVPELNDTIIAIRKIETTVFNLRNVNTSDQKDYVMNLSDLPTWFQVGPQKNKSWFKYLSTYTRNKLPGVYKIRGSTRVFYFLRSLLRNMSSTQFRTYATWEVLRLLSNVSGLAKTEDNIHTEWHCYKETRKLFAHAVALNTFLPVVNKSRISNIHEMADNIVKKIDETIRNSQWLRGSSLRKTLEKLHRINRQLGYPGRLDTAEGLEDYYRKFPDVDGPYLDAYLKSAAASMERLIDFVTQPTASVRDIEFETRKVNAYYYNGEEYALFPAAILTSPTYSYGAPPEINYGSLGRIITHEFMHALDRSWTNSGRARSGSLHLSADMERAYLSTSQCLLNSAATRRSQAELPRSWTPEFLADHMGQSALIDAYRDAKSKSVHVIPGLERFSSDQLFFISSCLFLCSSYNPGTHSSHPPSIDRCNVPLKHSPEFAEAFACASGSAMNPLNKCSSW